MKPSDIYDSPPISESTNVYGFADRFLPEFDAFDFDADLNTRVVIKTYADMCFDGERIWCFESVWFDGRPVMIVQYAGRGGDDDSDDFITDKEAYLEMVSYFESLCEKGAETFNVYSLDEDIKDLGDFYGHRLSDFYNAATVNPKYKVGDIVVARVIENHLKYYPGGEKKFVEARCKIERVSPYNPSQTYFMVQLDRRMGEVKEGEREMVFNKNRGGVGATASDSDIIGLSGESDAL